MPRISAVMSVYNEERYLNESVDSILAQTFTDFEFIIVDDGSTDGTAEILSGYDDARVKVITQANQGLIPSLNTAIKQAGGEFLARMDADDISAPERFAKQVDFLRDNPGCGMCGTWYEEIDSTGARSGRKSFPTDDRELRRVLVKYNPFCHASVMMRRDLVEAVGGYDVELSRGGEDYDLWFKLAERAAIANLPEVLIKRRYTSANISTVRERDHISGALVARRRALASGRYPRVYYLYLIRPWFAMMVPAWMRGLIRRWFLVSVKES